jgi:hypothetical protein
MLSNHPFSQYHPKIAEELAEAPTRQFLGRVDVGPPLSWHDDVASGVPVTEDALLTVKSSRMTTKTMSLTRAMAIPTPQIVSASSEPHKWESAQVMDYDEEMASSMGGNHKVAPVEYVRASTSSGSNSNRSYQGKQRIQHAQSNPSSQGSQRVQNERRVQNPEPAQDNERAQDPFSDKFATGKTRLPVLHIASSSQSSTNTLCSNERALKSLMAALDATPEEVQERLRVASLSPSIISASSYNEEDDVTSEFPLPPS